jgi:hypothetical protein
MQANSNEKTGIGNVKISGSATRKQENEMM